MDLNIGRMPHGPRNSIADVSGVRVGHCAVDDERHKTGVTVILPCEDDIFRNKMPAAYHVLNGFGKTTGLMQIGELGTLETPIALTNTLNVGLVHDAMVEYMCRQGERRGYPVLSVNPVAAGFTHCVQMLHGGSGIQIHPHASHKIMLGRHHRNRLFCDVITLLKTCFIYVGKMFPYGFFGYGRK